ncbi:MAG: site-2 protease family protein, partial [Archaeoglobaceae archaeon]|nr:site-2 protease family protein [Archaeoglobaceae archaeon]
KIDGTPVLNFFDFNREMSRKKPNQVISVEVYDPESGEFKVFNLTLVEENGRAFMGVIVTRMECIGGINFYSSNEVVESLRSIPASLDELAGWLLMISLPFTFQGFTERGSFFDTSPVVLWFLDSLYWIAWINLWVGLFNCLPAIPLDGGRVFHETFSSMLARRFGDKAEKVSMRIAKALSVFIFLSLAMMILISTLRHLGL